MGPYGRLKVALRPRTVRDGEPRTSTSTCTQLLSSDTQRVSTLKLSLSLSVFVCVYVSVFCLSVCLSVSLSLSVSVSVSVSLSQELCESFSVAKRPQRP